MAARLLRDVPNFVRAPLDPKRAEARLHREMQTRESRFLATLERTVYRHEGSPYRALLRHAGCTLGDVRVLVAQEGLEGALRVLASHGVYASFAELKGREPIIRGSLRRSVEEADFDNPVAYPHFVQQTSGSGGLAGRIGYSLPLIDEWAVSMSSVFSAHGLDRPAHVCWWPIPANWFLMSARLGHSAAAWFYPVHPLPFVARVAAAYLGALSARGGYRMPPPVRGDLERPEGVLDWLRPRLRAGQPILLRTTPSAATRLAVVAQAAGETLRSVTFLTGGEPVTEARRQQLAAVGAGVIVMYASSEHNGLAYGCASPRHADDVHVMTHRYAVIQRGQVGPGDVARDRQVGPLDAAGERRGPPGTMPPNALLVTALSPLHGKVALNADTGDEADLVERTCGCPLGTAGLRTQLSGIRSFEKLTAEGVTFARLHLERLVETALPARFGGSAVDYQLVEEEGGDSATRLVLRVRPSVGAVDEAALRAVLLSALGRGSVSDRYQAGFWRSAGTVVIRREAPLATRAGKLLPFQPLRDDAARAR